MRVVTLQLKCGHLCGLIASGKKKKKDVGSTLVGGGGSFDREILSISFFFAIDRSCKDKKNNKLN